MLKSRNQEMELEAELSALRINKTKQNKAKKLLLLWSERRKESELNKKSFHLHLFHSFIFIALFNTTLKNRYCYFHFRDDKNET